MGRCNIFTYGSLSIPAVMEIVALRKFNTVDAVLFGYQRYQLKDLPFPGILPSVEESTPGLLHFDLDEESFARVSFFEDDLYQIEQVEVQLENGSNLKANTYVVAPSNLDLVVFENWSMDYFIENCLENYLLSSREWMEGYISKL